MKAVILAGGFGTRLGEETQLRPKPMLEVGGLPVLWHIMKIYSHYGINEFVVLLGYRGWMIKDYFLNYFNHRSDVTIDLATNDIRIHRSSSEPWKVTLLETGLDTLTGGRLLRARDHLKDGTFMLTYGDGVADIDIAALLAFHKQHGKVATMTAVYPEGRFGAIGMDNATGEVHNFMEKPVGDGGLINGGFMVFEPSVFEYFGDKGDATILERGPMEALIAQNQLYAYHHPGFWHCMDTKRDMDNLNKLWSENRAPWKLWDDGGRVVMLRDRAA